MKLSGLFGPPDVDKLTEQNNIKGLIRALKYREDNYIQTKAADALGKIGDARAVKPLITALKDRDWHVRKVAAEALGMIGDTRAVKRLITALEDKNDVGQAAAEALVKIGAPAVEPLIVELKDRYGWGQDVSKAAAEVLGMIGDARAVEPLITVLDDRRAGVHQAATESLGKIGAPAVEPLVTALEKRIPFVRQTAVELLGKIGDARAVEPLITALKDGYEDIRQAAIEALGKIGDARAVEPLIADLEDARAGVHLAAAKSLVEIGAPAVELLIAALKDKDMYVRRKVADILGEIDDTRSVEPLIGALVDEDQRIRSTAAKALGKIGDPRSVEPLIAALKDPDEDVRRIAVEALGKVVDARAIEPLIAALKDSDSDVRQAASKALDQLGFIPQEDETGAYYWIAQKYWAQCVSLGSVAVEPLIAALKEWSGGVRKSAVEALGKIGDARAVEPLIAALKDNDIQQAAAHALDRTRWQPQKDEAGAYYWIAKKNWKSCASLGSVAIQPLLKDENVYWDAAGILDRLEWQPQEDETGTYYWIAKRNWERCASLGIVAVEPLIAALKYKYSFVREGAAETLGKIADARAVDPLIDALKDEDWAVRKATVGALVRLFQLNQLDETKQRLILAQKNTITHGHTDIKKIDHTMSDCHDDQPHTDTGIGLNIPF